MHEGVWMRYSLLVYAVNVSVPSPRSSQAMDMCTAGVRGYQDSSSYTEGEKERKKEGVKYRSTEAEAKSKPHSQFKTKLTAILAPFGQTSPLGVSRP